MAHVFSWTIELAVRGVVVAESVQFTERTLTFVKPDRTWEDISSGNDPRGTRETHYKEKERLYAKTTLHLCTQSSNHLITNIATSSRGSCARPEPKLVLSQATQNWEDDDTAGDSGVSEIHAGSTKWEMVLLLSILVISGNLRGDMALAEHRTIDITKDVNVMRQRHNYRPAFVF